MATLAEIVERKTIEYFDCVAIDIDATHTYYMTQAPFDLKLIHSTPYPAYDTFKAAGGLLAISEITDNAVFSTDKINVTVAGIIPLNPSDDPIMIEAQTLEYIDKPLTIYRAFLNPDNAVINGTIVEHQLVVFKGYIDAMNITQDSSGDTTQVSIDISSHWTNFDRVSTRYTNNTSQHAYYPTDVGFEYSVEIQKEITWREPS
jgi:hypothetical protein